MEEGYLSNFYKEAYATESVYQFASGLVKVIGDTGAPMDTQQGALGGVAGPSPCMRHPLSVDGATGDWCTDHATLFQHWADTLLAGHAPMPGKNTNVPSHLFPLLSDHAVVNLGTSLTPLLKRCGQYAQLALT